VNETNISATADRPSSAAPGAPGALPAAGEGASEPEVLLRAVLALLVIGFAVWLVLAWTTHRREYSATGGGWHRGARNFIEVTVVPEDRDNLACASDAVVEGLHCGFGADRQPHRLGAHDGDTSVLRPYNTVNGELFLGSGLWDSAEVGQRTPGQRFTLWCDLDIVGALRAVKLRWQSTGSFDRFDKSLAVGALRDCVVPQ